MSSSNTPVSFPTNTQKSSLVTTSGLTVTQNVASAEEEKKYVPFRKAISYEKRLEESKRVTSKYPDKVAVIIERGDAGGVKLPLLKKRKYLVSQDSTVGEIMATVIRPSLKLKPSEGIFILIENKLPPASSTMGQLRKEFCRQSLIDEGKSDGFLVANYAGESVFGDDFI